MRKIFFLVLGTLFFITSCQDEVGESQLPEDVNSIEIQDEETLMIAQDQCGTMGVLEDLVAKDPTLIDRMNAVEEHTKFVLSEDNLRINEAGNIVIPVIFHVIYRTSSENIPTTQLQEQIDALNEDFNLNNPGRGSIPAEFQPVEASVGISFVMGQVIRVQNKRKRSWRPDDSMKFTASGGSDVIDPQHNLNVWVVNNMPYQGGNILGYAQFPGGDWATDGVVLDHRFVGNTQYSTGRTATHEVGHWLNLRHIWGDGGCSYDDFVTDTPISDRANTGCPTYPTVHCGSNDMTMNFMDYSSDPCLNMFTNGQKDRMHAVFAPGGFREAMAQ